MKVEDETTTVLDILRVTLQHLGTGGLLFSFDLGQQNLTYDIIYTSAETDI